MNNQRLSIVAIIFSAFVLLFLLPRIPFAKAKVVNNSPPADMPILYSYPIKQDVFQNAPEISAKSAIVLDAKTGVSLYEKNPTEHLLPASTAKLMTAIVALEKCPQDKIVTIVPPVITEPTQMGLSPADSLTVENLLYGLLVASGNDAAFALSAACANSTEDFVKEMNFKARDLKMNDTNFANPAGFDDPNQYTTAKDLAKLAKVAIANPLLAKIVATKQITITDTTGKKIYPLTNVNKLLGEVVGIEGIKTGQTPGSLEVLTTQTTRDNNTIITVVLGSNDRFKESKDLIEWAFKNYQWINP